MNKIHFKKSSFWGPNLPYVSESGCEHALMQWLAVTGPDKRLFVIMRLSKFKVHMMLNTD